MRSEVASPFYLTQIQARWRKLGDLDPGPGSNFHVEYFSADHAANRGFVHREEMPPHPVPSLVLMAAVDTHHDFHFRLSPKTGVIWPSQAGTGIKVGGFIFAVAAYQFDPRFGVGIFAQIII